MEIDDPRSIKQKKDKEMTEEKISEIIDIVVSDSDTHSLKLNQAIQVLAEEVIKTHMAGKNSDGNPGLAYIVEQERGVYAFKKIQARPKDVNPIQIITRAIESGNNPKEEYEKVQNLLKHSLGDIPQLFVRRAVEFDRMYGGSCVKFIMQYQTFVTAGEWDLVTIVTENLETGDHKITFVGRIGASREDPQCIFSRKSFEIPNNNVDKWAEETAGFTKLIYDKHRNMLQSFINPKLNSLVIDQITKKLESI